MDTVIIRNQIASARTHEAQTRELAHLLRARVTRLHSTISVRAADPHLHLLAFATAFVECVPDLLDALEEVSRNSAREEVSDLFGAACRDFFIAPPALLRGHNGMNGAMAKSYLCHRTLEEINDYLRVTCQQPLLPVDFTSSSLIIHHLLGEPFGNLLDGLVHSTTISLLDRCDLSRLDNAHEVDPVDLLAACQRRSLMDDGLRQAVVISSLFPGCTIH